MLRWLVPLSFLAAVATVPVAVHRIFLDTPIEREMGTAQKIFYFHVPLAWSMMLLAVICGVAAAVQLRRHSMGAQALTIATAEMVLVTGTGVLVTGPIWGNATWGTPWTWDARQVTTGLLWLIFASYILVRRYGAVGSERLAAALAIFGAIDVPVIYYAVKVWKTTHPTTDVVGTLPSSMWQTLWIALAGLLAVVGGLVAVRWQQEMAEIALDEGWISASEADPSGSAKGVIG